MLVAEMYAGWKKSCSSSGERNCINTASGNSHSMLVAEMCAGWKKTFFQHAHISANIELLLPDAVLIQFLSPDDEHDFFQPAYISATNIE
jgi:hypothetical protein